MHVQAKSGREPQAEATSKGSTLRSAGAAVAPAVDDATVAVIALALELERQPEASRIPAQRGSSQWALAGRGRVLRGR
jgi:hypothetical protein